MKEAGFLRQVNQIEPAATTAPTPAYACSINRQQVDDQDAGRTRAVATARVEIGVAAVHGAARRCIVIVGSLQVGIGWGAEGPKAGFFPFYIGC